MKKIISKIFVFFFILFCSAGITVGQTSTAAPVDNSAYNLFLVISLIVIFHIVFIPLIFMGEGKTAAVKKERKSVLTAIKDKLSGATPIAEEGSILMSDNYDGIMELDNKVPPWFNILFYGTIIFALIYFLDYHVFKTGKLPFQEYADEVNAAELMKQELIRTGALINENNVVLLTDAESLNSGKQIFTANCVQCHGNNAQGVIGPNLTDQYWIHGGGVKNVFKTVKYGVPVKGMIAWQGQFNPKMIQQVVSYVISLQGSNPPGGKAPEGNPYTETDSTGSKKDSIKTEAVKDSLKSVLKKDSVKTPGGK